MKRMDDGVAAPDTPDRKELGARARKIGPRLFALALPHRRTLGAGFIALLLAGGLNLFFPAFLQRILNNTLSIRFPEDITTITGILIALFAVQACLFAVRHYCFTVVGYRVVRDVRERLFRALMSQDVSFFDAARSGDLLSRITSDSQSIQNAVAVNFSVAVRYLLQVIGATVLMFWISPRLALILLLLIPVLMIAARIWGKRLRNHSRTMQAEIANATVVAEEAVGNVPTVRLFAGRSFEEQRFTEALNRALRAGEARAKVAANFSSAMVFLLHSSITAMLCYGASLVVSHHLSLGDLTAFTLYGIIVAVSFGFLINVWDEFMHAVGAGERIFAIVDSTPQITSPSSPVALDRRRIGEITFDHVFFSYPSRPDVVVLRDVSFSIQPGQTVALVGPSGSGKSTVAALIPRFYDPTGGEIRFAGVPLQQLDLDQLRSAVALVAQEPQLFSVSIEENIRYGKPSATPEEVREAAAAAHIAEFIESLPEGYRTLVGSRGIQLSGGQRQRIAIARALLKNPPFLILDEATSALDSESEHLVQKALTTLMKGRTTLIIAHRLSTVQHADVVLVLRDGAIIQSGSHDELMESAGIYRTLVEYQML